MRTDTRDHRTRVGNRVVAASLATTLVASTVGVDVAGMTHVRQRNATVVVAVSVTPQPVDDSLRVGRVSRAATRAPVIVPPAPPPLTDGQRIEVVVNWALAQRGKPYLFGAAGPYAYDCSGLTMMAYQQVGIALGHWTGWQLAAGRPVARWQLRRGDLVFPLYDHVGLYLGGDMMVVAPTEGESVQIQRVWGFYAARRIIG